jgi:hypothetical protein
MPSSNRRAFLGTVSAALVGVAGCFDDASTGATDEPTSSTPTETTSKTTARTTETASFTLPKSSMKEVGYLRVAVADPTVRKAVAYRSVMGSGAYSCPTTANSSLQPSRVEPESRRRGRRAAVRRLRTRRRRRGVPRRRSRRPNGGSLHHVARRVRSDSVRRSLRGGSHGRLDNLRTDVAARREWNRDSVSARRRNRRVVTLRRANLKARSAGSRVRTPVVRGDGGRSERRCLLRRRKRLRGEGRFLAAVYWPTAGIADDDESTIVDRSVAAGDRIEWTKTFDTEYAAGADGTVTASVEGVVSGETKVDLGA